MRETMRKCREALAAKMRAGVIAGGGDMTRSQANAAIAEQVGVTPATLRNWEAGLTAPRGDKLLALERLYGRSAEELMRM